MKGELRCRSILIVVLSFLVSTMLAAQPTRPDAPTASPLADRIIPMEAVVNGSKVGTWPFVERQGQLYVGKDAFEDWRVLLRPRPFTPRSSTPNLLRSRRARSFQVSSSTTI